MRNRNSCPESVFEIEVMILDRESGGTFEQAVGFSGVESVLDKETTHHPSPIFLVHGFIGNTSREPRRVTSRNSTIYKVSFDLGLAQVSISTIDNTYDRNWNPLTFKLKPLHRIVIVGQGEIVA
jgi:hypothetical protein